MDRVIEWSGQSGVNGSVDRRNERWSEQTSGLGQVDAQWYGPWLEAETAEPIPDECAEHHLDPLGQERGGCPASGCWCYAWAAPDGEGEESRLGINSSPDSICCQRCGFSFSMHLRGQETTAQLEALPLVSHTVVHQMVFVRGSRDTSGAQVGILRQGDSVCGRREGSWLRLDSKSIELAATTMKVKELHTI